MNSILANWPIPLEGIYHISSMVNGKASWTSTSQAIWYEQEIDNWKIGQLGNIGSSMAVFRSDHNSALCETLVSNDKKMRPS